MLDVLMFVLVVLLIIVSVCYLVAFIVSVYYKVKVYSCVYRKRGDLFIQSDDDVEADVVAECFNTGKPVSKSVGVFKYKVIHEFKLDDIPVVEGTLLDGVPSGNNRITVFHFTGWWSVEANFLQKV